MKLKFTHALAVVFVFFSSSSLLQAQNLYRSTGNGTWGTLSIWEHSTDGGTTWAAATVVPTDANSDGITIRNNVSVTINRTADQIIVNSGATLSITGPTGTTLTVNESAPAVNDLIVNGTLLLGTTGTTNFISGTGRLLVNNILDWVNGRINLPTTIAATGVANLPAGINKNLGANLINNGLMNWHADQPGGGSIILNSNIVFTNNGTINFYADLPTSRGLGNSGTNSFVNNGTLHKIGNGVFNNTSVAFTNSSTGVLSGTGEFRLTNTVTNNGTVKPGSSPGVLTVSNLTLHNQAATVELEILNGSGAGTGYDQLNILAGTPTSNLSNVIINVIDISPGNAPAPTGTYNSLLTGSFTGLNINNVNVQTNYSKTGTTTTSLAIEKIALFPLPVIWGGFEARLKNNNIELTWETLSEENSLEFVIEHSTDGANQYTPIAKINAQGNSTSTKKYTYIFNSPDKSKTNYFRIKQIDIDGKSKYSDTRFVKFNKGSLVNVTVYPNPVKGELFVNSQTSKLSLALSDMYGRTILTQQAQAGTTTINTHQLAKGYYLLAIYEDGVLLETKKILKK